ncbi:MAG: hypothetical protein EOP56_09305 [Sphingobacteriales bacterium]|nr:MAG: hypothetical protein EOP56_09305 [Sphingobacteriales bacterium]
MKYQVIDNNGRIEIVQDLESVEPKPEDYETQEGWESDYFAWDCSQPRTIPTLETDRNHWLPLVNTVIDESKVKIVPIGGWVPSFSNPDNMFCEEPAEPYAIPAIAPKDPANRIDALREFTGDKCASTEKKYEQFIAPKEEEITWEQAFNEFSRIIADPKRLYPVATFIEICKQNGYSLTRKK